LYTVSYNDILTISSAAHIVVCGVPRRSRLARFCFSARPT